MQDLNPAAFVPPPALILEAVCFILLLSHTMACNPTVVLVLGSFHVVMHASLLHKQVENAGYPTISYGLRTVNSPSLTLSDDVDYLHEKLQSLVLEQGRDVVLYLQSYAGFPGSAAIEGLSKEEQAAKGKDGGIIGLIYQAAFLPHPGDTIMKVIGGHYEEWEAIQVGLQSDIIVFHASSI